MTLVLECIGCHKSPEELYSPEAVEAYGFETAREFVLKDEGTLNLTNGHFACDSCYIKMGMPTSPQGWKAP